MPSPIKLSLAAVFFFTLACSDRNGKIRGFPDLACVGHSKPNYPKQPHTWWTVEAYGRPFSWKQAGEDRTTTGSCDVSPNPSVRVLIVPTGDGGYGSIALTPGGKPVFIPHYKSPATHANGPEYGEWACDGRCLVTSEAITQVETGTITRFPRPIQGAFRGLSPDSHTLVTQVWTLGDKTKDATFCVVDLATSTAKKRRTAEAQYPWINACEKYSSGGACTFDEQKHLEWKGSELASPSPAVKDEADAAGAGELCFRDRPNGPSSAPGVLRATAGCG